MQHNVRRKQNWVPRRSQPSRVTNQRDTQTLDASDANPISSSESEKIRFAKDLKAFANRFDLDQSVMLL